MENAILGRNFMNEKGKTYTDYMDLKSAALYFLFQESGKLGQFDIVGDLQTFHIHEIQFIGQRQRFLFMYTCLGHNRTDKYISISSGTLSAWIVRVALSTLSGRLLRFFVFRKHFDTYAVRLILLAVYFDGRGLDRIRTGTLRHEREGVRLFKRRGVLSVDKGGTGSCRSVGTCQMVEVSKLRCTQIPTVLIDGVG